MQKKLFLAPVLAVLILGSCGKDESSGPLEAWDNFNDPQWINPSPQNTFEKQFSRLPLQGQLKKKPWRDDFWPSSKSGLARRWGDPTWTKPDGSAALSPEQMFSYALPSLEQLKVMTAEEINKLSPAEKYDIFRGKYDYPTVTAERLRNDPKAEGWVGICDGWAAASLSYPQPGSVTLPNPDGIKILFAASDIKALLTLNQALSKVEFKTLGRRCHENLSLTQRNENDPPFNANDMSSPSCRDVNPGGFHIAVANLLDPAKPQSGFLLDITRDRQVWNHPVYGYSSRVLSSRGPSVGAAKDTVREVVIQTKLRYAVESASQIEPLPLTEENYNTLYYLYSLELNEKSEILGGEWLDESYQRIYRDPVEPGPTPEAGRIYYNKRPDFMWYQGPAGFGTALGQSRTGEPLTYDFEKLQEIYKSAISDQQ